ncbi:hypothetical protein Msil_1046 [Methylocella silvestris BL2]|uniref:Uncharacterized protein n=2 Tax=Methylocella silvestris TaxID=199596 RepID=B8ELM1_METSB|nr:hypothetical protein Msil_1046 [Methylocella silvestris BL2]
MDAHHQKGEASARWICPIMSLLFAVAAIVAISIGAAKAESTKFRFNDLNTTIFGPAYADILLRGENFLTCKPPVGRAFSYALCFFSGPMIGSSGNPPLPCKLAKDGKTADCTCYGLTTEQYPPMVPYFIDINAILNLDLYLSTVSVCGHDGANCNPREFIQNQTLWNSAPACTAANNNVVIPTAQLISVYTPVKNADYGGGTTTCSAGKYAGCMTAPCYETGKTDGAGNKLVTCKCPVYDGPFELGQANRPCDANVLTPWSAKDKGPYIWSASHNPALNPDPPVDGCLADAPGDKGCPLYSASVEYPVGKGSAMCKAVCESYKTGVRAGTATLWSKGLQVAYSCDAALCTTLGIGQTGASTANPAQKATLLKKACGNLAQQSGLEAIMALEQINKCSCCASQVCGCANAGTDIDAATQAEIARLNAEQERLSITPQCQINDTLCGAQKR